MCGVLCAVLCGDWRVVSVVCDVMLLYGVSCGVWCVMCAVCRVVWCLM